MPGQRRLQRRLQRPLRRWPSLSARTATLLAAAVVSTAVVAATLVIPTASSSASGIGELSGTVTEAGSSLPLAGIPVRLVRIKSTSVTEVVKTTTTKADGTYSFSLFDVAAGPHGVGFGIPFDSAYRTQNWQDISRFTGYTAITILDNSSYPGINAKLSKAPEYPTTRLAGTDRFATAVAISQQGWGPPLEQPAKLYSDTVFLASGLDFPDALSVAALAGSMKAPLLLTARDSLPDVVRAELVRLKADNVVIAGGEGAVSARVATQISEMGLSVQRVSGIDRYATSRAISELALLRTTVFLATGRDFPDALSAAAAAGAGNVAVLLVDGTQPRLDAATWVFLKTNARNKIYLAGGSGAISSGIEADLQSFYVGKVERLAGEDRFETAIKIAPKAGNTPLPVIASGFGFADALAGAVLAGAQDAPLYLSTPTCLPARLGTHMASSKSAMVFIAGGEGVLSPNVLNLRTCSTISF